MMSAQRTQVAEAEHSRKTHNVGNLRAVVVGLSGAHGNRQHGEREETHCS